MSNPKVVIVDYGLGNLFSVQKALLAAGANTVISESPIEIQKADRLLIPGVGAFHEGMSGLKSRNLIDAIREVANAQRPILGICLGAQLMLSESEEHGLHPGLDLIKGMVVQMRPAASGGVSYKLPHIGWNELKPPAFANASLWSDSLLRKLPENPSMYFLHSYVMTLQDPRHALAMTNYGHDHFCSVFQHKNLMGVQPHPERSGETGLQVYRNFLAH